MRIAITGSSGFVGSALVPFLRAAGHEVFRLVRVADGSGDSMAWNPTTGALDARLPVLDAVVHLAGESVAQRWTAARRQSIVASRGPATERLCRALAALPTPPRVLVSASAIGIYGNRGDEVLDESSPRGSGFLADVAADWEAGTAPAAAAGMRVVNLRIGMVLDPSGGALARMLPPFRMGVGGRLGNGRQWTSWITRHDLVRAIAFALGDERLRGPVAAVAPGAVTNQVFTQTLGKALRRPTVLPVPALVLRLVFGAMADELLLASHRVRPTRLLDAGFTFEQETIGQALRF